MTPNSFIRLLVLAWVAAPAVAADGGSLLTLEEAIRIALVENDRIGIAEAEVGESEAGLLEAKSGHLPQLGFDATYARTTNPTLVFSNKLNQQQFSSADFDPAKLNHPDPLNDFSGILALYQPIYTGGRVGNRIDAATETVAAAASLRERTRQEVVQQVIAAYTDSVLAGRQLEAARASVQTAEANVELVADLYRGGLVVESDLLRAQVRETEVRELLVRSEAAVEITRATLNMTLGRDLDTDYALPQSIDLDTAVEESVEQLANDALSRRPDLLAGTRRLNAAQKSVRSAKSGHLPEIGATGVAEGHSAELFGNYGTNWSVFVGARFNLFDGKQTKASVRRATERQRKAVRQQHQLQQLVELEVRRAFHELRASGERLEQAARAVQLAEAGLRIVRDRYGEGLTTLVELLESESALTRARTREVSAQRDVLLSRATLDLSVGRL